MKTHTTEYTPAWLLKNSEISEIMNYELPPDDEKGLQTFSEDLAETLDIRTQEIIRNAAAALEQCETQEEKNAVISTASFFAAALARGIVKAIVCTVEHAASGIRPLADIKDGTAAYLL